jgi:hypothetical protein
LRVSEGINLKFVLTKKLGFFFKHRASEIRVKRIRVNRGVGVYGKFRVYNFGTALYTVPLVEILSVIMSTDI